MDTRAATCRRFHKLAMKTLVLTYRHFIQHIALIPSYAGDLLTPLGEEFTLCHSSFLQARVGLLEMN